MAPITNELAGEHHSSHEVPPLPIGEAAALVAKLLSESDQPAETDAQTSLSSPSSEPALVTAELLAVPALHPPSDRRERSVLSFEPARPLLPFSKIGVVFVILGLAALIFGSGLAVGYGILGRHSAQSGKPSAQANTPAVQYNATSEAIDSAANLPRAASVSPQNSAVTLHRTNSVAVAGIHTSISSDGNTDHNLQPSATEARSEQAAITHAMSTSPRLTNNSPISDRAVASIPSGSPQPDRQATSTRHPGYAQSSGPSASDGVAQALVSSAQSANPAGEGNSADPLENASNVTSAPESAETPTHLGTGTDAPSTQEVSSDVSGGAIGASPGHIDPSQLVYSVQPVYPLTAKQLHVEGDVELRIVVGTDGTVQSVGLVSGPPSLVMAAIDAARQFRYKPALLNGKPIETLQTIEMSFKLKN
ncbi:MAG: TonB family protein [Candidatus Acidiferrales bacterium]